MTVISSNTSALVWCLKRSARNDPHPAIPVHPVYGPLPVAPIPDTPTTRVRIAAEWRRQADVSLAKIKAGDPVKGGRNGRA